MRCDNGHQVTLEQKYCPECGVSVEQAMPFALEHPPQEGRTRRRAWVLGAGAVSAAALIAGLIWAFAAGADSQGGATDESGSAASTETPSAQEVCFDGTIAFLNATAEANNAGDQGFLFRAYGSSDPRTTELITMYENFQGNVYRVGKAQANAMLNKDVDLYCSEYGEAPPLG